MVLRHTSILARLSCHFDISWAATKFSSSEAANWWPFFRLGSTLASSSNAFLRVVTRGLDFSTGERRSDLIANATFDRCASCAKDLPALPGKSLWTFRPFLHDSNQILSDEKCVQETGPCQAHFVLTQLTWKVCKVFSLSCCNRGRPAVSSKFSM